VIELPALLKVCPARGDARKTRSPFGASWMIALLSAMRELDIIKREEISRWGAGE
jgi:hypothetical protein